MHFIKTKFHFDIIFKILSRYIVFFQVHYCLYHTVSIRPYKEDDLLSYRQRHTNFKSTACSTDKIQKWNFKVESDSLQET